MGPFFAKSKSFFANYCYYRGFGRDPRLPEKVETRTEHVALIPNILLAEKALALGFPKGRENYRQVQHKICMDKVSHSSGSKWRSQADCGFVRKPYGLVLWGK